MGRGVDFDHGARILPLLPGLPGRGGHPSYRAEQVDQRGEIVWPPVKAPGDAALEKVRPVKADVPVGADRARPAGARPPARLQAGKGRHRLTDRPLVDQLAGGLPGAAEKSVWSAADPQALFPGQGKHLLAFLPVHGQGFLVIDALARFQGCEAHLSMREVRGQVDDDLDLWVGQQLRDAACLGYAVFCRPRFCGLQARIRTGNDLDAFEQLGILQIDAADRATADQPDLSCLNHDRVSFQACSRRIHA